LKSSITFAEVMQALPELKMLNWRRHVCGSFPSLEVHGNAGIRHVRLLDAADSGVNVAAKEKTLLKERALLSLSDVLKALAHGE
jgi:hypothetical protein